MERGDLGTLRKHREEIRNRMPGLKVEYAELALGTVEIALEKGSISTGRAEEIRGIFRGGMGK